MKGRKKMQKKKMQQPLYSRNHGIFSGVRLGRRAVTAICLMGTMLPFAPPAENAFAAMVQNVPDQAGRQDMEIIPEATPSNATFSDATPSDTEKETAGWFLHGQKRISVLPEGWGDCQKRMDL
jgi:hypothetical protein